MDYNFRETWNQHRKETTWTTGRLNQCGKKEAQCGHLGFSTDHHLWIIIPQFYRVSFNRMKKKKKKAKAVDRFDITASPQLLN